MLRMKTQLLVAVVLALASGGKFALAQQFGGFQSSPDMLKVATHTNPNPAPAGTLFEVFVRLDIEEGWKLNAHRPNQDNLIPTTLTLEPLAGFTVDEIVYPEGELRKLDFSDEPMNVYEKQVAIGVRLRSTAATPPGEYVMQGNLRVQACSGNVCLPPGQKPVSIPLRIAQAEPGAVPAQPLAPAGGEPPATADASDGTVSPPASGDADAAGSSVAAMFEQRGALLAFLGIFLMGLALNLTPCVYPMLSITVSLFGARVGEQRRFGSSFAMAAIYVLGIVSMYTVLGVVAAFSGAMFGSWLQSPIVLIGIGALFFLLALSMFGLYELQVPYWLMNKLGGAQQATGVVGYYLSGLVVGVFAAPCIGPPIIALLAYVAARGEPMFGLLAFFFLSLGLGFPYLILGAFSGLLTKLPKSGAWMVWVRKVFGVALVGLALFYIALAVMPDMAPWSVAATLIAGGFYLGFIENSAADNRWFTWLKWLVGTVAIAAGILFVQGLQKQGITWENYSAERLAEAVESGQPVLLDFYADWCIPCHELDRVTFTDRRVIAATERFVRMKVNVDLPTSEELSQRFAIAGVPTIVFLGPDGQEQAAARVVGFVGPDEFLNQVEKVK